MIGEALRLLRVTNDIKAIDLAGKLGISPSYLSEIERGKKEPPLDLIKKFALAFNTKPSNLLFFSEKLEDEKPQSSLRKGFKSSVLKILQAMETSSEK